jgi:hypothetical protein
VSRLRQPQRSRQILSNNNFIGERDWFRGEIMLTKLSLPAILLSLASALCAQTYPDTFKVNYFSSASGLAGGTVRITNVGTQIGATASPAGNMCAMIYVFDPKQEMAECCGCLLTPDGLATLDVFVDLTSSPLTSTTLTTGDIKIVSSTGYPACKPTDPRPAPGIRAWATHLQNNGSALTETEFSDSELSAKELYGLSARCAAILTDGSGFGICTCGTGL